MAEFKAPSNQQNKTAAPVQAPLEASSLGAMEYEDSRASAFQFIQLKAAADENGRRSNLAQLQNKASSFSGISRIAQLQAMINAPKPSAESPIIQREENKTGLPDGLKSGMESISGMSLDDVKVHRNSDKPAQLQAHAYAQGSDIHLGAGQEKHLPHELGHVVQQKEGRVKPTVQLQGKININDDSSLEKEADVLGQKAQSVGIPTEIGSETGVAQRMEEEVYQGKFAEGNLIQLSKDQPIQLLEDDIPSDGDLSQDSTVTTEEVEKPSETKKPRANVGAAVWADLREQVGLMKAGKTTTSKVGATLARRIGSAESDDLWNTIAKLKKLPDAEEPANLAKIAELEALKKERTEVGKKYDQFIGGPETFMSKEEIDLHLNLFKIGGAHAFITNWHHENFNGQWDGWGQDKNFVAPLPRANELVADARNKEGIRTLEEALGIPAWSWVDKCPNGIIWRYIIEPDKIEKAGLSMAGGKESGAYSGQWIAGGETEGGEKEATIAVFKGEEFRKALRDVIKVEALDLSAQTPIKT